MKSTTRFKKNKKGIECLNCKQPIRTSDNFCSNCGQVNDELPLSIKQFITEFFAGFFSFDSRFFMTFIPLIFKPGKVAKEYIEGKRKKYVNPFQLYLHVTILFFLILGLLKWVDEYKISEIELNKMSIASNDSIKTSAKDTLNKLTKSQLQFNKNTQLLDKHVDSILRNSNLIYQLKDSTTTKEVKDSIFSGFVTKNIFKITEITGIKSSNNWSDIQRLSNLKDHFMEYSKKQFDLNNITYSPPKNAQISIEDQVIKGMIGNHFFNKVSEFMKYDEKNPNTSPYEALNALGYEVTRWNIFYYKKSQDFNKFKDDEGFRDSYLDEIVSKISIALFFMLPIFTVFVWLIYFRKKLNYSEHLVLVFNIQTVFFILFLISILIENIFNIDSSTTTSIFLIVFLFYLYKSLKIFYKQGRIKTMFKFTVLNLVFIVLAGVGFAFISFIAFAL